MLKTSYLAIFCGAMLLATACGSARVVSRTQYGGVFALQGDRGKAMEHAHSQMQQHCQGPYQVIKEGEAVIGTDTVHADESYETEDGTVVNEGGQSTRQATEWRIEYQCGQAGGAPPAPAYQPPPPPPPAGGGW